MPLNSLHLATSDLITVRSLAFSRMSQSGDHTQGFVKGDGVTGWRWAVSAFEYQMWGEEGGSFPQ